MPRTRPALAILLSAVLVATACTEMAPTSVPAEAELARLKALGFRQVAGSPAGGTQVLSYSGPVNGAIACRQGAADYGPLQPRRMTTAGARQDITLDAYLQLSPGADGMLAPGERDGVYAVTIVTRPPGRRRAESIEMIKFGPTESAAFPSGLTCRPA